MIIPGLIDPHVHLRSPGGEHKEDFISGSKAALAGGFTTVLGMPNTRPPLTSLKEWRIAQTSAKEQGLCDIFLYAGVTSSSLHQVATLGRHALALKIYKDQTYNTLRLDGLEELSQAFQHWPRSKPIAFHAEEETLLIVLGMASVFRQPVHICHVSKKAEIEWIARAKKEGLPVTCEVTPHHLFLTQKDADRLGPLGLMRPTLAEQRDVDALWDHINTTIDCIASDHAPHTLAEKMLATNPPPGVPGLESTLPLMLTAVSKQRLTMERMLALLYYNPMRIFNLPVQKDTQVCIDPASKYTFPDHPLYTKCGWSPFSDFPMQGRITSVQFKGKTVIKDGKILN